MRQKITIGLNSDDDDDEKNHVDDDDVDQWCTIRLTCSHPELTKDHVLTSAYVIIF